MHGYVNGAAPDHGAVGPEEQYDSEETGIFNGKNLMRIVYDGASGITWTIKRAIDDIPIS